MISYFQGFGRNSLRLTFNHFSKLHLQQSQFHTSVSRCLYGYIQKQVGAYRSTREDVQGGIGEMKDAFRNKIDQYINDSETNVIYKHDMRTMLHLAEDDRDLQLLKKMLCRYDSRSSDYEFGPIVLRLLYTLGKADVAFELFTNPDTEQLFLNLTSYATLMDLLFEKQMYPEILEVYTIVCNRLSFEQIMTTEVVTLYLAACAKLNTEESLTGVKKLVDQYQEHGKVMNLHACMFASLLALRQGKSELALEFLKCTYLEMYDGSPRRMPRLWRNMLVICLATTGKVEESLEEVAKFLESNINNRPEHLLPEANDELKQAVLKTGSEDMKKQYDIVYKELETHQCLDTVKTLEQIAFRQILLKTQLTRDKPWQIRDRRQMFTNRTHRQ